MTSRAFLALTVALLALVGCGESRDKATILNMGVDVAKQYGDPDWKQMHCAPIRQGQIGCTTAQHHYIVKVSGGYIDSIHRGD